MRTAKVVSASRDCDDHKDTARSEAPGQAKEGANGRRMAISSVVHRTNRKRDDGVRQSRGAEWCRHNKIDGKPTKKSEPSPNFWPVGPRHSEREQQCQIWHRAKEPELWKHANLCDHQGHGQRHDPHPAHTDHGRELVDVDGAADVDGDGDVVGNAIAGAERVVVVGTKSFGMGFP